MGEIYQVEHYNLDMILFVGYRVKSHRGIEFWKWANKTLKKYIIQGYAVNEKAYDCIAKKIEIQSKMLACTLGVDENDVLKSINLYN